MVMTIGSKENNAMKKIIITLAAFVASFSMVSCDMETATPEVDLAIGAKTVIIASIEDGMTRATLSGNDTDGYDVVWSEGDQIKIGSEMFTLTEGAGTTKGVFSGNKLADGTYNAYYATNDGTVPLSQTFTTGKIANSPMEAQVTVTNGEAGIANFKNIGGLLRLTIKKVKPATVRSIAVNGTLNNRDISMVIDCGDNPVELTEAGSEFYIAMTEGAYTNFSIEINSDGDTTYKKTLSSDKSLIITRSQITNASFKTNTLNGHEFVDLGLPSGIFWATCNIGASNPEDAGTYYAWGETDRQESYTFSWDTYKYGDSEESLTKYYSGDGKTTLEPEDDAAFKKWKEGWRMPTADEYKELIDHCYWEWYSGDVPYDCNGWIVYKAKTAADKGKMCNSNGTGKIKGYSLSDTHIFFPVSGRIFDGESEDPDYCCYYWTSSLYGGYSYSAQDFAASNLNRKIGHYYRCTGEPVRAVCE